MIRFRCEQCSHEISVQDQSAGKQGRCPKCGNNVIVPDKSTTLVLKCGNCGLKISIPRTHAGQKGRCPNCKNPIAVQAEKSPVRKPEQDGPDETTRLVGNDVGLTLLDVPEELRLKDEPIDQPKVCEQTIDQQQEYKEETKSEETKSATERELPWLIDIFLYPTSTSGLVNLAFFVGAQLVLSFLRFLPFLGFVMSILIGFYMFWYITECVRDSAAGRIRAPEAFATSGLGEMYSQWLHIVGCYLIFFGPVGFYFLWFQRTDIIFWLLLAYGIFFFPMGLLACVMFDSIRGLNPVLLLSSIFSTFVQYSGLVLLVATIVLAVVLFTHMQGTGNVWQNRASRMFLMILFNGITLYAIFVVAHLLGRFYYKYQDKLNWEV
jgi:DNA-directed RNA polymerase subunit RPC12/RpoP